MAEFMYFEVRIATLRVIASANYVALTCDKVGTVNNASWISIHVYVVHNWSCVPYLSSLQKVVEGSHLDNLTFVIINALRGVANMERLALAKILLCFGADGISNF